MAGGDDSGALGENAVNKNIRYVNFKTEEERDMLVEHYNMYGYFVKVDGDRIVVNSKWPKKPKKKEERKPRVDKADRR